MDEQSAGIVTLYYIKQLSPSDAACSKQIKLPRTQARRFVGDLRHKQRAAVTVLDHRNVLWEFLCTCYGCQYALSRVAVFCNTYQLKAGQYLIFYRDSLMRLRVAVTGSLSCKLMRQLTTQMTDGPNCLEQQGLLPELHTSDEEPTDTTEILEFAESALHEQHLPATSLVLPTGQAAAGGPGHSMFDAPGAVWQQASLQGSQLLQTRTASGCMYELPAGMTTAQQGGRMAPSVHRPCDEAATQHQMHMLAAGSFAQQAQQHPGHQQQQHAAFLNPAGCWAPPAAATAAPVAGSVAEASLAPSSAQLNPPHFTLNSPSGFTLVCHERLDELESPDGHDSSLQCHHQGPQQSAGQVYSNSRSCHLDAPAKPANSRMQHADQDQVAVQFVGSGKLIANGSNIRQATVGTADGTAYDSRMLVASMAARLKNPSICTARSSSEELRRTAAFRSAGAVQPGTAVAGGVKAPIQRSATSRSAGQLTAAVLPEQHGAALHTTNGHMAAQAYMPASKRTKLSGSSYHYGYICSNEAVGSCNSQELSEPVALPHMQTTMVLQHQNTGSSNSSSGGSGYADAGAPAWPLQQQAGGSALPGGCRLLHSGAVMLERSASTPGAVCTYTGDAAAAAAAAAPANIATAYHWDCGVLDSSGSTAPCRQQAVHQAAGLPTHHQQLPRSIMAASRAPVGHSRGVCHHGGIAQSSLGWKQLEAEEWSAVTGLMLLSEGTAGPL